MLLVYENRNTGVSAEWKKPVHVPPHLHEAIEVVYVTDGEIELGVGQELFHMDEGDFAVVFPNVIHHYQVFGEKENKVIFLYLEPTLFPSYYRELQIYSPKNPVVKKEQVHPDVVNAIKVYPLKKYGRTWDIFGKCVSKKLYLLLYILLLLQYYKSGV